MRTPFSLVVFSHLRWNFVYQRPQHVLSRLAKHRPVLFVEEPVPDPEIDAPRWDRSTGAGNVTVLVPRIPVANFTPSFQNPSVRILVQQLAEQELSSKPVVWTYTPASIDLIDALDPTCLVYDCMDELSAFLNAPQELRDQERRLLKRADVVFTGGPSLFRSKRNLHPEVYCFPSSVDVGHFAKGAAELQEAADQASLPSPRLGFFGVIDERLDIGLLEAVARRRPHWQIVLVGPVVKIDPVSLPALPNIHYLGARSYDQLPAYIQGWDVCLMPFALNDATKFISPTKVLEYMAARKPIVSTPITDVKEPYGSFVRIGAGAETFIEQCDQALQAPDSDREWRQAAACDVLGHTSWDKTASEMESIIEERLRRKSRDHASTNMKATVLVAGAGPTGLSAAFHLADRALLVDQNDRVGGWCRSVEASGFTFDYAGHIMFSADPYVHQMYKLLLGENVHWQDREAWIYSYGVHTRYPFQGSLFGLPPNVVQECIVGAIEARYGAIQPPAAVGRKKHANGAIPSQSEKNGTCIKDCCADGLIEAETSAVMEPVLSTNNDPPKNFEEFIYRVWGAGIAKHFAVPYNRKLWAVPLDEMETSWLGGRVPLPDLKEMVEGALQPATKPMGPNARFGYPLRGGFQALMDGFLPHLKGPLLLGTKILSISPAERTAHLSNGTTVDYKHLISTMPLPTLVGLMGAAAPPAVREAAATLRNVSVRCVHIGVGREALTEKHWIYYPGDTVFHRVFVQGNASPHCNPPGGFGLTCEITYSPHKPLPCDGDALTQLAIRDCIRVGLFEKEDPILTSFQVDMPYAYVVYDHKRKEAVDLIRTWMLSQQITLSGRYSEWEYYNSDHAFIAGKNAAETALREVAELTEPRTAITPRRKEEAVVQVN